MTSSRIEVITSVERRRRWSRAEKEALVAASLEPGVSMSDIARTAGLHVSQLFRWRKQLCEQEPPPRFLPVTVAAARPASPTEAAPARPPQARGRGRRGVIEIDLGAGRRVRVDSDVDGEALRCVLDALSGR